MVRNQKLKMSNKGQISYKLLFTMRKNITTSREYVTYQFFESSTLAKNESSLSCLSFFFNFLPEISYPMCSSSSYHLRGTSPTVFRGATYFRWIEKWARLVRPKHNLSVTSTWGTLDAHAVLYLVILHIWIVFSIWRNVFVFVQMVVKLQVYGEGHRFKS